MMKLKALDQILVSSVQPDVLRPGQEFEVSDATGEELMKKNPNTFELLDAPVAEKAEAAPKNKAEDPPANKAKPAPASKVDNRRSSKG